MKEKLFFFATPIWLDWPSPCGLQVSFQPSTTVGVGKQYPIIGPPPSTAASASTPPPCAARAPPYTSTFLPLSRSPPPSTAPSPYTASPSPPERASTTPSASFKIKDGTNPKGKKVVQKGMPIKSGRGVNCELTGDSIFRYKEIETQGCP